MNSEQRFPRLSRRSFLASTAATVGGMMLAACGGVTAPTGGSGGDVTLRWAMWSGTDIALWEELGADVTKKYPNIKVKVESLSWADYWSKLQTQIASNTQPDIVSMQSLRMPGFAARRALQPLQPFIEKDASVKPDDFFTSISDGLSFKKQVYGFGYDVGPIILYYNKDLFKAAGVEPPSPTEPMTWDQFREKAAKLTNPSKQEYGFVVNPAFDSMVPWIWSAGGDYMNSEETASTLDTPAARTALQFITDLLLKDKSAPPINDLANSFNGGELFYAGKVGMTTDGPWSFGDFRKNANFDWDIAPIPAGPGGSVTWVAGSGFGISSATKYSAEAWKALEVITSQASLEKLAKAGRAYPARKSAVPAFIDPNAKPANVALVEQILSGNSSAKGRFYRTTTTWQETDVMFGQEYNPIYTGQITIDQMIEKVKPKFDELLTRHQEIMQR